ncbi:sugar transferase [Candidatus Atribacteria bacterium 1244-E10-H5-B2]|nr:MAG: sugar transferase [Candidatus Atribacteria bacterium 1244-E10-H5-B2]
MVKRVFDLFFSIILLIVLAPLFVVVGVLIKLDSPGPVFFKQKRVGKDNKTFMVYKFRSMSMGTPDGAKEDLGENSSYVTRVGRIIRRFTIDELPNLFNVVRGEMSLVGPRPPHYMQYGLIKMRTEAGIHRAMPGIAGYAQVMRTGGEDLVAKVKCDKYYVEHMSLWLDIKIITKTAFMRFSSIETF